MTGFIRQRLAGKRAISGTTMVGCPCFLSILILLASCVVSRANEPPTAISDAIADDHGFLVHQITSPYQSGATRVRVLLPDKPDPGRKYPVIYVLPVEALDGDHYGDGLLEVKRHDLQNRYATIFVEPTFSDLPWYADHPADPRIRQETYFLDVIVPFVDKTYPSQADAAGRLLLGFSKSGWGAISLLLRHPDLFGKAAAWDAPLMLDKPDRFGTAPIFGTAENFERYRIPRLLHDESAMFRAQNRIALLGYGNFHSQMQAAHQLMSDLHISHTYHDGPKRSHDWHSGWVAEAVQMLLSREAHQSRP